MPQPGSLCGRTAEPGATLAALPGNVAAASATSDAHTAPGDDKPHDTNLPRQRGSLRVKTAFSKLYQQETILNVRTPG